ncbi:hypothetical protein D3C84_452000 [compost metagenome]
MIGCQGLIDDTGRSVPIEKQHAVVVRQHQITRLHGDACAVNRLVDLAVAATVQLGGQQAGAASEDRQSALSQLQQISHGAVDHDARRPGTTRSTTGHRADRCVLPIAAGVDHQHVARLYQRQRPVDGNGIGTHQFQG